MFIPDRSDIHDVAAGASIQGNFARRLSALSGALIGLRLQGGVDPVVEGADGWSGLPVGLIVFVGVISARTN
jgi:hypothetical protein